MDKVKELENKYDEILQDIDLNNLTEVGYAKLRDLISSLDSVKNEAFSISADMLAGLARDENGKFLSKDNIKYSITDIAKISTAIDNLTDKIYDVSHILSVEERAKTEQALNRMHRVRDINAQKSIINNQIKILEIQIKNETDTLAGPLYSDILRQDINFSINDMKLRIDRLKKHLESFDIENIKLREEVKILKEGGKLEIIIDEQLENEINKNNTAENEPEKDVVNPIVAQENEPEKEVVNPMVAQENEPEKEVVNPMVVPENEPDIDLENEQNKDDEKIVLPDGTTINKDDEKIVLPDGTTINKDDEDYQKYVINDEENDWVEENSHHEAPSKLKEKLKNIKSSLKKWYVKLIGIIAIALALTGIVKGCEEPMTLNGSTLPQEVIEEVQEEEIKDPLNDLGLEVEDEKDNKDKKENNQEKKNDDTCPVIDGNGGSSNNEGSGNDSGSGSGNQNPTEPDNNLPSYPNTPSEGTPSEDTVDVPEVEPTKDNIYLKQGGNIPESFEDSQNFGNWELRQVDDKGNETVLTASGHEYLVDDEGNILASEIADDSIGREVSIDGEKYFEVPEENFDQIKVEEPETINKTGDEVVVTPTQIGQEQIYSEIPTEFSEDEFNELFEIESGRSL